MQRFEAQRVDSTAQIASAGLTIRQKEPKNLKAPFDRLDSYLTPAELFYIRSHFPIQPSIATLIAWASMVLSGIRFP